jgi:membrane protein YdbS with pleckstrin-like domain
MGGVAAPAPAAGGGVAAGAEEVVWSGVPSFKALAAEMVGAGVYAIGLPVAVLVLFDPACRFVSHLGGGPAELMDSNRSALATILTIAILVAVVLRLAKLAGQMAALRGHRYRVTNQRIVVESGVLTKKLDEIDMRLVEDIEFQQTLLQRLLGIGQLVVLSADKKMRSFRLLGVERPREVRELIRTNAFAATRGQLFTRST